jgi:hypothetical protein
MLPRLLRLLGLCLLALWSSATAASAAAPDPRITRARQLCDSGDAHAGVLLYAQIYVQTLQPILVYHQARCYQRNGDDHKAIERYREYLRVSRNLPGKQRDRIEARIQDLRPPPDVTIAAAGSVTRSSTPGNLVPVSGRPGPTRASDLRDRKALPSSQKTSASPADPRSRARLYSLVTATGAGVALGAAVTFHVAREDSARQHNRTCYPFRLDGCDQLKSRVTASQTGALVAYGTAAFLAGLSTYLYLHAPDETSARERTRLTALACNPTPTLDGIACGARF